MPALLDRRIDALRASEYWYLDAEGRVYLDYTGAGLPAQAQLTAHTSRMHGRCFGNPHSVNPASAASTELIERARDAVLAHFNAPRDEYVAIFTSNASAADADADADAGICVRTGCFCNPGAAEAAFGFTGRDPSQMPGGGAVRASVGLPSNLDDVRRFLGWLEETYAQHPVP
jgi:selenocysteine lyase/cysteine desulfurase